MILTIKYADFSAANIGTLSSYVVSKIIGAGATFDIPHTVSKNSSANWVITLDTGYTFGTYSITMGSEIITPSIEDNVMTISIAEVTSNVRIVVATVNDNTGEGNEPAVPPVEPSEINLGTNILNGWVAVETGIVQSSFADNWRYTDYIAIPSGVTSIHTDDITAYRSGNNNTTPYAFYDADKNYIGGVDTVTIPAGTTGVGDTGAWRNSLTYNVPENAAYVIICWTAETYKHITTDVNTSITTPVVQWVY